jgi:hypothetical protein
MYLRAGRRSLVEWTWRRGYPIAAACGFDDQFIVAAIPERVTDLPVVLIEPHRNRGGIWRIKFCYDADQPLSMSADQASSLATDLYQLGEDELAAEIDDAVRSATRYGSM